MQQDQYSNNILTLKQTHRLMEQSRFQNKSTYYNNLGIFTKASIASNNSLERDFFFNKPAIHTDKKEIKIVSLTIHKIQFKMEQKLKCNI